MTRLLALSVVAACAHRSPSPIDNRASIGIDGMSEVWRIDAFDGAFAAHAGMAYVVEPKRITVIASDGTRRIVPIAADGIGWAAADDRGLVIAEVSRDAPCRVSEYALPLDRAPKPRWSSEAHTGACKVFGGWLSANLVYLRARPAPYGTRNGTRYETPYERDRVVAIHRNAGERRWKHEGDGVGPIGGDRFALYESLHNGIDSRTVIVDEHGTVAWTTDHGSVRGAAASARWLAMLRDVRGETEACELFVRDDTGATRTTRLDPDTRCPDTELAIDGDTLYIARRELIAYSLRSGATLWRAPIEAKHIQPTRDDLFVLSANHVLHRLERGAGRSRWWTGAPLRTKDQEIRYVARRWIVADGGRVYAIEEQYFSGESARIVAFAAGPPAPSETATITGSIRWCDPGPYEVIIADRTFATDADGTFAITITARGTLQIDVDVHNPPRQDPQHAVTLDGRGTYDVGTIDCGCDGPRGP